VRFHTGIEVLALYVTGKDVAPGIEQPRDRAMSKKSTSLMIAALTLAMSASSAFALDAPRGGQRHLKAHHAMPYNARASARFESPYVGGEPFTAAQKRAFQTPTGAEVDRW